MKKWKTKWYEVNEWKYGMELILKAEQLNENLFLNIYKYKTNWKSDGWIEKMSWYEIAMKWKKAEQGQYQRYPSEKSPVAI